MRKKRQQGGLLRGERRPLVSAARVLGLILPGRRPSMTVEECVVCTEDLGLRGRPAVQLSCGHVFCRACVDQWAANKHSDCPSCRAPFRPAKVRALVPWEGGLLLKQESTAEQAARTGLEEARVARAAMERRANAALRAVRQHEAAEQQRCRAQQQESARVDGTSAPNPRPAHLSAAECAKPSNDVCRGAPILLHPHAAATVAARSGMPSAAAGSAPSGGDVAAGAATSFMPPPPPVLRNPLAAVSTATQMTTTSTLTEEQRQRAAANKAAALERRREREAAAAAAAAASTLPSTAAAACDRSGLPLHAG